MIIAGIFIAALVFMGLFLWFIAYSSTTDLSHDQRFKPYLNKAYIVKQPSALKRSIESSNRFSAYYIDVSSEEDFKNDPSILKKYHIGDTITFSTAKKYFSYHIGDSYYLLGKEKLDSGEIIEFEYGANFDYSPAIWESLDEFLERRKIINDFP
ncbi:hypothetical protein CLV98_10325 [Dyadobacter jejuensis]|uniref:Uncharacterized protein n=2 Tax=Dyadobacter jejuensis TaxID=1082580 RepID=A0A316APC5_9BACT|nr:hypothetical protein CLV98_10325 [Dyadobacter jejuensis]